MTVKSFLASLIVAALTVTGARAEEGMGGGGEVLFRGKTCAEMKEIIGEINVTAKPLYKIIAAEWHESGTCIPKDFLKAAQYYLFAAEDGFVRAYLHLGYYYAKGLGVARDLDEARFWFKRFVLTTLFQDEKRRWENASEKLGDKEMPEELKEELDWARDLMAASAREQYRVALKLRDGDGLPLDRGAADYVLGEAVLKKLPEAMYELGRGYLARDYVYGSGLRDDIVRVALMNIQGAADARYLSAEKFLGLFYADATHLEHNYFWSYVLLLRARKGGAKEIEDTLGRVEAELSEKDRKQARIWANSPTDSIPLIGQPKPEDRRELRELLDE